MSKKTFVCPKCGTRLFLGESEDVNGHQLGWRGEGENLAPYLLRGRLELPQKAQLRNTNVIAYEDAEGTVPLDIPNMDEIKQLTIVGFEGGMAISYFGWYFKRTDVSMFGLVRSATVVNPTMKTYASAPSIDDPEAEKPKKLNSYEFGKRVRVYGIVGDYALIGKGEGLGEWISTAWLDLK